MSSGRISIAVAPAIARYRQKLARRGVATSSGPTPAALCKRSRLRRDPEYEATDACLRAQRFTRRAGSVNHRKVRTSSDCEGDPEHHFTKEPPILPPRSSVGATGISFSMESQDTGGHSSPEVWVFRVSKQAAGPRSKPAVTKSCAAGASVTSAPPGVLIGIMLYWRNPTRASAAAWWGFMHDFVAQRPFICRMQPLASGRGPSPPSSAPTLTASAQKPYAAPPSGPTASRVARPGAGSPWSASATH